MLALYAPRPSGFPAPNPLSAPTPGAFFSEKHGGLRSLRTREQAAPRWPGMRCASLFAGSAQCYTPVLLEILSFCSSLGMSGFEPPLSCSQSEPGTVSQDVLRYHPPLSFRYRLRNCPHSRLSQGIRRNHEKSSLPLPSVRQFSATNTNVRSTTSADCFIAMNANDEMIPLDTS